MRELRMCHAEVEGAFGLVAVLVVRCPGEWRGGGDLRRLWRWGWGSTRLGRGRWWRPAATSKLGLEGHNLGRQLGDVLFGGHSEVLLLLMLRVSRLKLSSAVRARLRPGTYHILVLTELQRICGTGAQGDRSLLNALSRKCYMHTLQYVHRGTLP